MANEDKATRYHRLRRQAGVLSGLVGALVLVLLLATGASSALSVMIRRMVTSEVAAVVVYTSVVATLLEFTALPFLFYQGVVLEQRYGLSRLSVARWWTDWTKASALGTVVVTGVSALVSGLLRWTPDHWWLWAAAAFALAMVLLAQLVPVLLLPLFYECTPLERPRLTNRLLALAEKAGTRVIGVFEWKLSDRTRKANAALAGLGATRRILVSDTLLTEHTDDEIEVILAHELAHHVHGDLWWGMALEGVAIVLACWAGDRALEWLASDVGVGQKHDPAGLPILALAGGAVFVLFSPIANALSRAHERRADRYALTLTGNAPAFVSAMKRLAAQNLSEERPSRLVEALFLTHPASAERIAQAQAWQAGHSHPQPR